MIMIINGKEISEKIKEEIAAEVSVLKSKGISCGLAVILVGDDPASAVYVRNKKLACEKTGIYSEVYTLPEQSSEKDVLDLIDTLNKRSDINGILCQLPLPKHINEQKVINAIDK
ncbi:MAG: bifunctional 5,10-methylene-tetrahydrofolate dehydrogenase/5,10-methylene-tetrahydrofolate cyclohydrolase, partial [Oscillospiraceae bacterium]|nr:bifunctional 5,10-methylene-tetrahydrofolate dehydrogenase/5,10-methylene-tetrahydrofolate cyclohydrolase [Candidatus Equicaccousia limihippi]